MEEQKRSRVSIIGEDILNDKNLTPAERMVYARICYFEEFFESVEATAEYLGIKIWTVQSAKRKLEKLGYIVCVRNTGRGKRYVADVNLGIYNKGRVCSKQGQSLVETKSDVGENKVRLWKNQDIGKKVDKKVSEIEKRVDSKRRKVFKKPSVEEVQVYCEERKNSIDPEEFVDFYESKGWLVGKSPMKDWKAAVRTWEKNSYGNRTNKVIQKNDTTQEGVERAYELWKEVMGQPCKRDKWNDQAGYNMMYAKNKGEEWLRGMLMIARECKKDKKADFRASGVANLADLQKNQEYVMDWYRKKMVKKDTKSEQVLDFLWKSR